jgi:hypothetical protein
MRTRFLGILLMLALLGGGRESVEAADPLGPFCMTLDAFADRLELFALPNGGGQFLLSVRNVSFPNTYAGSLIVNGPDLIFSFISGNVFEAAAISFSGTLNAGSFSGTGKCVIIPAGEGGCGGGKDLIYTVTLTGRTSGEAAIDQFRLILRQARVLRLSLTDSAGTTPAAMETLVLRAPSIEI